MISCKSKSSIKSQLFKLVSALLILAVLSCSQNPKKEIESPAFNQTADSVKPKFTAAMIDNKNDPSCGMPVSAGIADTVHYKGKVYGFCSDECKQIFLKNPDSVSRLAKMK
jgi:YHS domain-containing protein